MIFLRYVVMVLLGFLTINIHAVNTEPILKPTTKSAAKNHDVKTDIKQSKKFPGEPWKPKQKANQYPGEPWQPKQKSQQFPGENWQPK